MSIVLACRVTDSLMQHGRNNGKKMMAVRIIKHSFEIIHLLTDQNPIQVLVDAIINRCFLAMCIQSSSVWLYLPFIQRSKHASVSPLFSCEAATQRAVRCAHPCCAAAAARVRTPRGSAQQE